MFLSHLGFKTYFLFIFWSKNGRFCRNQWKFGSNYHETFLLSLVSQLSVHCQSAGFHHCISRANASISKSFLSKRPPWGLNIIMKIYLVKLVLSDSKVFTNVYCDQHLTLWFKRCALLLSIGKIFISAFVLILMFLSVEWNLLNQLFERVRLCNKESDFDE